jgi:hypothetical protein
LEAAAPDLLCNSPDQVRKAILAG